MGCLLGVNGGVLVRDGRVDEIEEVLLGNGATTLGPSTVADDGRIDVVVKARPGRDGRQLGIMVQGKATGKPVMEGRDLRVRCDQ